MKIHEYQAKEILRKYEILTPKGVFLDAPEKAEQAYTELNTKTVVVKAQIHAGGRGKAGGVQLAHSLDEAKGKTQEMFHKVLHTPQTGAEGKEVLKVLLEEGLDIKQEYYLAITLDRSTKKHVLIASKEGGTEIEEVAEKNPDAIIKEQICPFLGIQAWQLRSIAYSLELEKEYIKQFMGLVSRLWQVYIKEDCSLLEINPLITTKSGYVVALDCKIILDDNALFRHKENEELKDETEEEPLEWQAAKYNLNYVKLDGNVGCMVNGAGLAMATMDIIQYEGGKPANFLDVGGGANVETVTKGFEIIISDKNVKAIFVNIFGGIVRCDRIANGIIEATKRINLSIPVVVRLAGTNAEEAKKILKESGLDIQVANDIKDGAQKVVGILK